MKVNIWVTFLLCLGVIALSDNSVLAKSSNKRTSSVKNSVAKKQRPNKEESRGTGNVLSFTEHQVGSKEELKNDQILPTGFNDIPMELKTKILSLLGHKDLLTTRLVSKTAKPAADEIYYRKWSKSWETHGNETPWDWPVEVLKEKSPWYNNAWVENALVEWRTKPQLRQALLNPLFFVHPILRIYNSVDPNTRRGTHAIISTLNSAKSWALHLAELNDYFIPVILGNEDVDRASSYVDSIWHRKREEIDELFSEYKFKLNHNPDWVNKEVRIMREYWNDPINGSNAGKKVELVRTKPSTAALTKADFQSLFKRAYPYGTLKLAFAQD